VLIAVVVMVVFEDLHEVDGVDLFAEFYNRVGVPGGVLHQVRQPPCFQ